MQVLAIVAVWLKPPPAGAAIMPPWVKKLTTYSVNAGGDCTWKVPEKAIVQVNGKPFIKLQAWCPGFVRLVMEGVVEKGDLDEAPTLKACKGLDELASLRNTLQQSELQPSCGLFADAPEDQPSQRKKRAVNRHKVPTLESMTMRVPAITTSLGSSPDMDIEVLRPLRCDDTLTVAMDADVIAFVVNYVQVLGIDLSTLQTKRARKRLTDAEKLCPKWKRYRKAKCDGGDNEEAEDDPTPVVEAFAAGEAEESDEQEDERAAPAWCG